MASGDCPHVVLELAVDDVHKCGEDSIQLVFNRVFVVKPHVEEWRSKNVDVSVGVEYESTFKFGILHS
ncbi:hypothetical protein MA16_Dca015477 [Dendrobium catenatum]|uniref:Uncharacterized protein n=1 Tax=Dendrobium catenatum TaxID=906689 RepID=A0A2I0X9L9_9ASPA|nr:hypothetical protein MA16_Dca015477 [Dendrobium catenatum]